MSKKKKNYYLMLDLSSVEVTVPVEADSLEEAINLSAGKVINDYILSDEADWMSGEPRITGVWES